MKKSKFFNFFLSFLPGASHMYCNQNKKGVLFMSLFFLLVFLAANLGFLPLLAAVVLWFYSFFDSINLPNMEYEQRIISQNYFFAQLKRFFGEFNLSSQKKSMWIGLAMIAAGLYLILYNIALPLLNEFFDSWLLYQLMRRYIPTAIIGTLVIILGVRLMVHTGQDDSVTEEIENE